MKAGNPFRLSGSALVKLPPESRLFMLPQRMAVGYDPASDVFGLSEQRAVAAFMPPGYTVTYNSAYKEVGSPRMLPLYSYAAVAFYKGSYYAAAVRIDRDPRHDCRMINIGLVRKNARKLKKAMAANRLIAHLENCALVIGCPNAQNFFLSRYEGPLPTSPACNASCAGCISYQKNPACKAAQPRIKFVPTPEEVAEVALFHISNTRDPIVSFGQGCEGEPLLQGSLIEKSIRLIRSTTSKGTINMNTNGSIPAVLRRLFDTGLDTVRISLNSARETYYMRYYKPKGYSFKDVIRSIGIAKRARAFVSINYLTMPGFTDSIGEYTALRSLVRRHNIDMIQWRNLNYDPVRYFEELPVKISAAEMIGIKEEIQLLAKEFPRLRMGYFNPTPRAAASPRR